MKKLFFCLALLGASCGLALAATDDIYFTSTCMGVTNGASGAFQVGYVLWEGGQNEENAGGDVLSPSSETYALWTTFDHFADGGSGATTWAVPVTFNGVTHKISFSTSGPGGEAHIDLDSYFDCPSTGDLSTITNDVGTNSFPSATNAPPPLLTNAVPDMTNTPSVTTNLPTVPNVNSNIVWNDTSATLGGVGQSVRDGNGTLNNTIWTAGNQDHADLGAVVNAIKTASGQDHADNGVLKAAIDQVRLQAHSDATVANVGQNLYGIQGHNDVQRVINAVASIGTNRAGSGNDTNGAQELTLQKLYASTTNLTGAALGSQSTLGGISNLLSHMATNGLGSGTNALAVTMTNYSTETTQTNVLGTLAGMSNLLASFTATNTLETNHIGAESSAGYAAATEGTNLLAGFGVQEFSGGDAVGSALSGWTISVPYGAGYTIDLNPFHVSWVVALAAFTRFFITWALVALLMMVNTSALLSTLQAQGSIRQASASGQSVLGNNLNLVTAILMAVLITAVMLAVPIYALGWLSSHGVFGQGFITFLAGNPFKSSQANGVGGALYITDQFFPLSFIAFAAVAGIGFKAGMNLNVWLTNTVARHLVG
jgi:hypothetical protein